MNKILNYTLSLFIAFIMMLSMSDLVMAGPNGNSVEGIKVMELKLSPKTLLIPARSNVGEYFKVRNWLDRRNIVDDNGEHTLPEEPGPCLYTVVIENTGTENFRYCINVPGGDIMKRVSHGTVNPGKSIVLEDLKLNKVGHYYFDLAPYFNNIIEVEKIRERRRAFCTDAFGNDTIPLCCHNTYCQTRWQSNAKGTLTVYRHSLKKSV